MGMREILGYAPVQPDGSVRIQVPAQVPFTIDVLDANARRITTRHTSWMQVQPGETKTCTGCHTSGNLTTPSHGRAGLTVPVNKGAPTTGAPFPGTSSSLFANQGETMAQTLERISCENGSPFGPYIAVLAAHDDRRHLCECLDDRRDDAAAGREIAFSYTYSGTAPRHSELAAHGPRQLHSLERPVPHHHPLCEPGLQSDAALHSELVEQRPRDRAVNGVPTHP